MQTYPNYLTLVLAFKTEYEVLKRCIDSIIQQQGETEIFIVTVQSFSIVKKTINAYNQRVKKHIQT